jgi:hypothetical protein
MTVCVDAIHRILELHGEILEPVGGRHWEGYFGRRVAIEHIEDRGDGITFDLLVSTSTEDVCDYFLPSEQGRGTTDKVVLTQDGHELPGARITGITRTALAGAADEYRVMFEVSKVAVQPNAPLEFARAGASLAEDEWIDVAVATIP